MKRKINFFITISLSLHFSFVSFAQVAPKKPGDKLKASDVANDLQKSNKGAEQVDLNNLISINKSGDASLSIPIVTVNSRSMSFPIQLNYQAGIKVNQKASEVGLGWNINFGSIVRDYGAFEPDYTATTAEREMSNIDGYGTGTLTNPATINAAAPSSNSKSLIYNGVTSGNLTPDNYHINIPGIGGNTFWNNAENNATQPHFVLSDFAPWKINFDTKLYEIDQEFSRINELNYRQTGVPDILFNQGYNLASAICIPPYVHNRSFKRFVLPFGQTVPGSPAVVGAEVNMPNNEDIKVKYEDFKSFIITAEDGTQYIFGRGLRGQKYLFNEDPFWSAISGLGGIDQNAVYGEWWKIDYIAEWLLTEIRSADYIDINGNEVADDEDRGDWIRIQYTNPEQTERIPGYIDIKVPAHREWMNFTQTDKYSSLMRERAYVTKIVTPIQEVDFTTSKRYDVEHDYFKKPLNWIYDLEYVYANASIGSNSLEVNYPVETMKYDKVIVKERMNGKTLNTVVFNYAAKGSANELAVSDYIVRNNQDLETIPYNPAYAGSGFNIDHYKINYSSTTYSNTYGTGRGKTTLLGINFFPEDKLTTTDIKSYKFDYGYNPSFSEIHKQEIQKASTYPTLRQSLVGIERYKNELYPPSRYPYFMQEFDYTGNLAVFNSPLAIEDEMGNYLNQNDINKGRHAWSLTKLTIPTGGSVELEYENDHFDINADRIGWNDKGALVDNGLPNVVNYNKIAIMRSMVQDRASQLYDNNYSGDNPKLKNRTFNMPMNEQSGGLRLLKKIIKDGINSPVVINYNYGTGHYSSVPSSYWENYLSAFSSFMTAEQARHSREVYSTSLQVNSLATHTFNTETGFYEVSGYESIGFYDNDFATWMTELSFNVRVDNTVNDNHYYSHIDEINADGSKIRSNFGDPLSGATNSLYYDIQKQALLKGYNRSNLILVVTNDLDKRHDIKLLKSENFSNTNTLLGSTEKLYSFDLKTSNKQIAYQSIILAPQQYLLYVHQQDQNGNVLYPYRHPNPPDQNHPYQNPQLDFYASATADIVFAPFTGISPISIVNNIAGNIAANQNGFNTITDDGYSIPAGTFTRHQSIFTKLDAETKNYKNVISTIAYEYETHGLLKTITNTNSTKNYSTQGPTFSPPVITVTENIYAFEAYAGVASPFSGQFLNKNMLIQKAGMNVYANVSGTFNNSTILNSSVQPWLLGFYPKPGKSFVFNGSIDSEGKIVGYSPFNYLPAATNDTRWQLQTTALNYNKFGQEIVRKNAEKHTRSVMGYNSASPKATIEYTDGWFDATYTGFEDLYNFNKIETFPGGIILLRNYFLDNIVPLCTNSAKQMYYVDNTNNLFNVGDEVIITPNPNITSISGYGSMTNLQPFNTKIINIASGNAPGAYQNEYSNWPLLGVSSPNTYFNNHKTILCFDPLNPFPANFSLYGASIEIVHKTTYQPLEADLDEFWYNSNSDNRSKVVNTYRTGTKAFYLASNVKAFDPNQKTPIRPVYIESSNCSGAGCTMFYTASCWIRNNKIGPVNGNPIVGNSVIKISYRIWDDSHTNIVSSGQAPLSGITNRWQYFEIPITVTKISSGQWLDVYIENATLASVSSEKIYIDDILVYPKGAKYQYHSFDKFLNATHSTEGNDRTSKNIYDSWGRVVQSFDANNQLVSRYRYFTTNNILLKHNFNEVITKIDGTKYNQRRQYYDGLGKLKQICTNEPSLNRRLISSSIDYDNQGRVIKQYNSFGVNCGTGGLGDPVLVPDDVLPH